MSLLDSFDRDVRDGVNDESVKSRIYFVMNRYFRNGGNIYEIYDDVNSQENLGFATSEDAFTRLFSK